MKPLYHAKITAADNDPHHPLRAEVGAFTGSFCAFARTFTPRTFHKALIDYTKGDPRAIRHHVSVYVGSLPQHDPEQFKHSFRHLKPEIDRMGRGIITHPVVGRMFYHVAHKRGILPRAMA